MAASTAKSSVFRLGNICFSVENCEAEFVRDLEVLFPKADVSDERVREIKMGCIQDMRGLINHVLKKHLGCIWIDAGCIVKNGRKILMAGYSGAGKSTTTMALAMGHGCKVLAEDILLIDQSEDKVIPFCSPFSLKEGTAELLEECVGRAPNPILLGEWSPLNDMAGSGDCDLPFDAAIFFMRHPDSPPELTVSEMSAPEFLRILLPISNVLRYKDALEKMMEYLPGAKCLKFVNGTVKERISAVLELCK